MYQKPKWRAVESLGRSKVGGAAVRPEIIVSGAFIVYDTGEDIEELPSCPAKVLVRVLRKLWPADNPAIVLTSSQ